ncbi:hypothetical protein [Methylobacterium brachiatum]|uniref:hypothetical protein n=1 Tax=Methylobacterium brachiatum TaxID=269660 RepID=UPI0013CEA7E1|nr:hypothetical protein [Methylobacterium brachiatum]
MSSEALSLYIELEDGKKADLEAISRASLAFAQAVREIAAFIDPFSDTKLELIDTTEGSLSLNTKIKLRTAGGHTYEITLRALVIVFATYIGAHIGDFVSENGISYVWEQLFGSQDTSISEKDKKDIVDRAAKAFESKAGERQIKQIYAELDQDPAISGVGVSKVPGARPENIVPRSEFGRRSGVAKIEEPAEKKRKNRDIVDAILVSPVLENDRKRRWRFKVGEKEFGAPVKDHFFLDAVLSGKHPLLMQGNIHMRIALETQEEFINGAWVEKDHTVWTVIGVPGQYQGPQNLLPFDEAPKTERQPKPRKR